MTPLVLATFIQAGRRGSDEVLQRQNGSAVPMHTHMSIQRDGPHCLRQDFEGFFPANAIPIPTLTLVLRMHYTLDPTLEVSPMKDPPVIFGRKGSDLRGMELVNVRSLVLVSPHLGP